MVTTTIQEQIIREAPEIEAIKLGLLQDAKGFAGTPLTLPTQQIAGLSGLQQQAFKMRNSKEVLGVTNHSCKQGRQPWERGSGPWGQGSEPWEQGSEPWERGSALWERG